MLSSIKTDDERRVARGIVNYRRVIEFLLHLKITKQIIVDSDCNLKSILESKNIVNVVDSRETFIYDIYGSPRIYLVQPDETFYECRMSFDAFLEINDDWESFNKESNKVKELIVDAINEMFHPRLSFCRYINEDLADYLSKIHIRYANNNSKE